MSSADSFVPISTAPKRSSSAKAELQRRLVRLAAESTTTAGWTNDGFRPDLDLLGRLLALTDPRDVRGGAVAAALDIWAATTLRQAGLMGVLPHATEPFYVGNTASAAAPTFDSIDAALTGLTSGLEGVRDVVSKLDFRQLATSNKNLISELRRLRKSLERATTTVLGESRRKQVDVFLADWDRGLELLISTKTFALAAEPDELVKNLPNRWEEFDGDLKNLRGRFPLAVIGALTIVPAEALKGTLPAFVDMMTKLTAPGRPWVNAYDRAAIIVAPTWEAGSTSSINFLNDTLEEDRLPLELQPTLFFDALLNRLLERAPISEHREARKRRAAALGQDVSVIDVAAEAEESALSESFDELH